MGYLESAWIPDRPSPTGTQWDDDFNSPDLDPKWTKSFAGSSDIDSTWPSHIYGLSSGTQSLTLTEDFGLADDASGSFSVTACLRYMPSAPNDNASLKIRSADSQNSFNLLWIRDGTNNIRVRVDRVVAGSSTFGVIFLPWSYNDTIYLHIERSGTQSWIFSCSINGMSWAYLGALTQNFTTLAKLDLILQRASGGLLWQRFGIDWVRVNWKRMQSL
jgi:hypothetical protein